MNVGLANSNAEEKSEKENTVFKIPNIIGRIPMVVNGTSDAFSWSGENSTANDIELKLSRKSHYNFNNFPREIKRNSIDKVEFDINDSEDTINQKLSNSEAVKKPFKFSTYL